MVIHAQFEFNEICSFWEKLFMHIKIGSSHALYDTLSCGGCHISLLNRMDLEVWAHKTNLTHHFLLKYLYQARIDLLIDFLVF